MKTLAIILGPIAALAAAIAFPQYPKATMATSLLLLLLGAMIIGFLIYGPSNYLLQVPESLMTPLHPWTLALAGTLLAVLGSGALAGVAVRGLMLRFTTR